MIFGATSLARNRSTDREFHESEALGLAGEVVTRNVHVLDLAELGKDLQKEVDGRGSALGIYSAAGQHTSRSSSTDVLVFILRTSTLQLVCAGRRR